MTELSTRIVEVTAYPDRARVARHGTIALESGIHLLEIVELPMALDPASLRAAGKFSPQVGSGSARLLGVDVRKVYYRETPAARVKELEDQIQALEDTDQSLADTADTLTTQAGLAKAVAEKAGEYIARGVALARADIGHGSALVSFVAQELAQALAGLRETKAQRRELARQLDKLRSELKSLQGSRGRERYTATVEVELNAAGELAIDLIYVVANAGWQPLYDVRLIDDAVELTYLGQITQRSGEDWSGVSLALSTARPSLAAVLPELKPWYVNAYQPPPPVAPMAKSVARAAVPAPSVALQGFAGAEPEVVPAVEMEAATAAVESASASVTFRLSQSATIPADGEPHKVTVAVARLDPKLDYLSVPKLAEFAYRRAKVKNSSDLLLLPGPASLFVEGDFIGGMPLKLVAPGEEFDLHLGVDDRVYVKRELKAREVDKKLLQDRRRLQYAYEIELRNLRTEAIALEVRDQVPVPRHESIKVRLEAADPKPAEQSELNELTWKLALQPNARQVVRFDFSVEHPRDMQVTGLP